MMVEPIRPARTEADSPEGQSESELYAKYAPLEVVQMQRGNDK